jgi:hypothetical protein
MSGYAICGALAAPPAGFEGWAGRVGADRSKKPREGLQEGANAEG